MKPTDKQLLKQCGLEDKELCDFCWHGDCDNENHRWVYLQKYVLSALKKLHEEKEEMEIGYDKLAKIMFPNDKIDGKEIDLIIRNVRVVRRLGEGAIEKNEKYLLDIFDLKQKLSKAKQRIEELEEQLEQGLEMRK